MAGQGRADVVARQWRGLGPLLTKPSGTANTIEAAHCLVLTCPPLMAYVPTGATVLIVVLKVGSTTGQIRELLSHVDRLVVVSHIVVA